MPRSDRSGRGVPLRRRLFALTAAAIIPLAVAAGLGLQLLLRQQRAQAESGGMELVRSVGTAVETELRSATSVLEALGTARALEDDDFAAFHERALRILRIREHWVSITLRDSAGHLIVDTAGGLPTDPVVDPASLERVIRTREAAVGGLSRNPRGAWVFAVRVPVRRGGAFRYVLSAFLEPEPIRALLAVQSVPADWVISIVDADGRRVARSRAHEATLGGRLSDSVAAIVAGPGREGFGVANALEGERIFTPYTRLQPSGWAAVLGIPTALVEAAAYRSLAVYGGGVLLSLAIGGLFAAWVARSISRPIAELREAALALGRRELPLAPSTSILEIRDVAGALGTAADELARGEAQRDELLRKEQKAREAAEAADRAKDEFVAVLSHELRTPLNAAYGWARMLQGGQLRDEATVARAIDAIVRNADVQVQLIDDLLDVSRISSGKLRLEVRPVALEDAIRAALDAVRLAAEAKGIRIDATLELGAGRIAGDPARLQQVVWNLLLNAVKFTPRGGRVSVRLARAGAQVELSVSDNGQGIAPELLPHVFERFRQADSSSTRRHGGLGLGLALVKHLVELHGGSVSVASPGPDQGSTFVVTLPIASADAPSSSGARLPGGLPAASLAAVVRLDGLRVLAVDDDEDAVALARSILERAGAEVRTSLSAGEALELLLQFRPDVVVSDIEMPVEDGYALVRKIRALPKEQGGETPAVALSAYGRTQDRARSLAAGYHMHVPKPVDPGELTAIVAGVAGASRADRG